MRLISVQEVLDKLVNETNLYPHDVAVVIKLVDGVNDVVESLVRMSEEEDA